MQFSILFIYLEILQLGLLPMDINLKILCLYLQKTPEHQKKKICSPQEICKNPCSCRVHCRYARLRD